MLNQDGQQLMSASGLLDKLKKIPNGGEITLPVMVGFERTALEVYTAGLKSILVEKRPAIVVLNKFPLREFSEDGLKYIYNLLLNSGVHTIFLDLRHLSSDLIADLYDKHTRVMGDLLLQPLVVPMTMHNLDYWRQRYLRVFEFEKSGLNLELVNASNEDGNIASVSYKWPPSILGTDFIKGFLRALENSKIKTIKIDFTNLPDAALRKVYARFKDVLRTMTYRPLIIIARANINNQHFWREYFIRLTSLSLPILRPDAVPPALTERPQSTPPRESSLAVHSLFAANENNGQLDELSASAYAGTLGPGKVLYEDDEVGVTMLGSSANAEMFSTDTLSHDDSSDDSELEPPKEFLFEQPKAEVTGGYSSCNVM